MKEKQEANEVTEAKICETDTHNTEPIANGTTMFKNRVAHIHTY